MSSIFIRAKKDPLPKSRRLGFPIPPDSPLGDKKSWALIDKENPAASCGVSVILLIPILVVS
jgi:hypothetical protein